MSETNAEALFSLRVKMNDTPVFWSHTEALCGFRGCSSSNLSDLFLVIVRNRKEKS